MSDIANIRADFPILSRTVYGKPLVYLDSAATSQKPICVIEKVNQLHRELNSNIHRGVHYLSAQCTAEYEQAREIVAGFIGAGSAKEIVFTSGATAAINLVAYSYGELAINKGDNIIITEMEHHANIVPWQLMCQRKGATIRVLPFDDSGCLDVDKLSELIDSSTKIVAITQCSNVLGTCVDVKKAAIISHSKGVPILVDGCQGVVHQPTDVMDLDCDFYVFSGHKLYAPTGIGVLYAKQEWLENMPPYMGGGDMVETVTFEKTTYAQVPLKFEAGTANYIGAIALGEAIRYLQHIDLAKYHLLEQNLMKLATARLQEIPGMKIYGTCVQKASLVSFNIDGIHPYDLGMIVDKLGVAIRTGTHCAEPTVSHYGVTAMARASFAIYNNLQDVEVFIDAVKRAAVMLR